MKICQRKLIAALSAVSFLLFSGFSSVFYASETDDSEDELIFALDEEEGIDRSVIYEEGELLISFYHDTSWEEIDQLVKAEAVDYTIIDDGESHIDPDLPEELAKYSNHSAAVDIVAPSGEEQKRLVFSTCPTTIRSGGYAYSGGTSYAAPQVAATVAMMMKIKPGLTPNQYLSRIRNRSTVDVDRTEGDDDQVVESFKLLNAGRAVYLMEEP